MCPAGIWSPDSCKLLIYLIVWPFCSAFTASLRFDPVMFGSDLVNMCIDWDNFALVKRHQEDAVSPIIRVVRQRSRL